MYTYSTRDLREAGFVWAQKELSVTFKGLEASDRQPGIFRFIFEIDASREVFENLLARYMNQEASVEPKLYDLKLNNLRDNLRKSNSN